MTAASNIIPLPQPASSQATAENDKAFLERLGARVREQREQRGLARRALALTADVSERYLAQLESGDGNISIILLRRIATALSIPVAELLDEQAQSPQRKLIAQFLSRLPQEKLHEAVSRIMPELLLPQDVRKNRIALVGLRGAGKSTLGAMLADDMQLPFIELHKAIEREAGMDLGEVFLLYGQSGYRRLERQCLAKILAENERAVISVGGGVVADAETYQLLLDHCYTVWLKTSPEEHMARVVEQGDLRPMRDNAEAMEDLKKILAAREPLYGQADIAIDTAGETPEQSLLKLHLALFH